MKIKAPSHGTVVAYLALFFAMGGTAVAATGSTFISGRANTASTTTTLSNPSGTALSLGGGRSAPALAVNNSTKIPRLNSDLLDGLDSSTFARANAVQKPIFGNCPGGMAMSGVQTDGRAICTMLAPPPPAPAPAQSRDKGFAIADLQLSQDGSGDWQAVARITNETGATHSGNFTVTVFRNNSVIATLRGSVSDLAAGNTNTVQFFSTDTYSAGDVTTTFQTDTVL